MELPNNKTVATYGGDIQAYDTQILYYIQGVEYQELLVKKLNKMTEQKKDIIKLMKNTNSLLETEIKQDEQKKESLLIALDSLKARNVELRKELLLIEDRTQNIIETGNIKIKKHEDHWLMCKKRFENIPHIHRYFVINNRIETVRGNINRLNDEIKNKRSIIRKKTIDLFNLDKKHVIQLADYMINKRPIILKNIEERTAEIKTLKYQIEIKNLGTASHTLRSNVLVTSRACKDVPMDIVQESSMENNNTTVLPNLQLQYMDLDLFPIKFDQRVNFGNAKANKRTLDSAQDLNDNIPKTTYINKVNEEYISPYFTTPILMEDKNAMQKFSEKKLIHVLKDIKLDISGAFKIVSKVNTNELRNVNIIKAEVAQKDSQENDSSQDMVEHQVENEIIEEIDLTKTSQNILLPPTQFLDFTQSSQEKRVTFNSIITIQNPTNSLTNGRKSVDENIASDAIDSQLNVSTASDDSYKKLQDFVLKKRKLNASPEFTYEKNLAAPMLTEKQVPPKIFDEQNKGQRDDAKQCSDYTDGTKKQPQLMEIVENSKKSTHVTTELESEPNEIKTTSDDLAEGKNCIQKDDAAAGPSFGNYLQIISNSFNISMNTTDCEDTDADLPQCIDSSLLLSPKPDDEIPTSSNKTDVLSQEVPNFLTGLRKTGFSFFGSRDPEKNLESDVQGANFNFTFGEEKKRGGLFSMFR